MRAPKSLWRTLTEPYTLCKLEYHRTVPSGPYSRPICTERAFQARWKEFVAQVQLDSPVATVLPKATGISWPFRLMGHIHPLPAGLGAVNQPHLPVDVHRPGRCLPHGRRELNPTHHLLGGLRALGPLPSGPLGVEHGQ